MFKFLKEKLGSWIKKSKQEIEEKEAVVEEKAEQAKEEIETTQELIKEEEKQKKKEIKKAEKEVKEDKKEAEEERKEKAEDKDEIKAAEDELKQAEEKLNKAKQELVELEAEEHEISEKKSGLFTKIKKTFVYSLTEDDFNQIFEGLDMLLLENNVALEVVEKIKFDLGQELIGKQIKKTEIEKEIKFALKKALEEIIIEPDNILETIKNLKPEEKPFVILFFGINGAGKTTSIAKFTQLLKKNNQSCILAASDTFRAASIEQLQVHADKLKVKMVKHDYGSDPSAVAFDAIKYAKAHKIDIVLIDTAGRMHTKDDLLREMEKICRVSKPNLKVFVAEAIAGNDATEQAKAFHDMIEIDGSILSKADIDEKGGTIISISYATSKPILYIGTGQKYDNLELFNKTKFIKQLGLDESESKEK